MWKISLFVRLRSNGMLAAVIFTFCCYRCVVKTIVSRLQGRQSYYYYYYYYYLKLYQSCICVLSYHF